MFQLSVYPPSDDSPASQALPRARIIRRRTTFDATRLKGRRVSNRFMALNFLARDAMKSGETGSVAFLTPKRVGDAAKRQAIARGAPTYAAGAAAELAGRLKNFFNARRLETLPVAGARADTPKELGADGAGLKDLGA